MKHTRTYIHIYVYIYIYIYIGSISTGEYYRLLTAQLLHYSSHDHCNVTFSHFFLSGIANHDHPALLVSLLCITSSFCQACKVKALSCRRKSHTDLNRIQFDQPRVAAHGNPRYQLHGKLIHEEKNGGFFPSFNNNLVGNNKN